MAARGRNRARWWSCSLYATKELEKLPTANFAQKIGVQIIQDAHKTLVAVPTIASNAGVEGAVVGKFWEQDIQPQQTLLRSDFIPPRHIRRLPLHCQHAISELGRSRGKVLVPYKSLEKLAKLPSY